jgi:hypothetical protein
MASNTSPASSAELAAHDRALLTDFVNRCTTNLADLEDRVLSILRDQLAATLARLEAPEHLSLSWTRQVTHPGTQPGPTVVHLADSSGCAYALRLDDELREALGLMLIDPSDPDEVAAENADCDEQDGPFLEEATSDALFHYLVSTNPTHGSPAPHTRYTPAATRTPWTTSSLTGRCARTRTRR